MYVFVVFKVGLSNLLECSLCFKITHALCIAPTKAIGIVNDDLPNSWECPVCLEKESKPRSVNRTIPFQSRESTGNVHAMICPPKPTPPKEPAVEKSSTHNGMPVKSVNPLFQFHVYIVANKTG